MIIVDDLFSGKGIYHGPQAAQANFVGSRSGHLWCHLASTESDDELHAFAARLGLKRSWAQDGHYDLVPSKRALAVKLGATEVTRMELAMVTLYDRKGRERPEYGRPERTARPVVQEEGSQLALGLASDFPQGTNEGRG